MSAEGPSASVGRTSLLERIAFLMSIKEEGKAVEFDHIVEKVTRDVTFLGGKEPSEREFKDALEELVRLGLLKADAGGYYRLPTIDRYVGSLLASGSGLLNRSYYLVYAAEKYYPEVADTMLPYLTNRPLSAVKVFSGKKDPIKEVEAIFVRYARYKPRPVHLAVNGRGDLMRLVHDHCVDFIPYVHGFDGTPDILLVDLDVGDEIMKRPEGFPYAKHVAEATYEVLRDAGCHPLIKFSGSRGFQVLCRIARGAKPMDFAALRDVVRAIRVRLEKRLVEDGVERTFSPLRLEEPYTTSSVDDKASRSAKVLVDWSSMKPQGDYRAPFSIHYKTGLVSLPIKADAISSFEREQADPFRIVAEKPDFSFARVLPESEPDALSSLL